MKRKIVPDVIPQANFDDRSLFHVTPDTTVKDAVAEMAEQKIGVVVVLDDAKKLVGIFSERDLLNRVVSAGLDLATTAVKQVMTAPVKTVTPDDDVQHALSLMDKYNCRHLPVEKDCSVLGMISIKDLYSAIINDLNESIKEREAFIHGTAF